MTGSCPLSSSSPRNSHFQSPKIISPSRALSPLASVIPACMWNVAIPLPSALYRNTNQIRLYIGCKKSICFPPKVKRRGHQGRRHSHRNHCGLYRILNSLTLTVPCLFHCLCPRVFWLHESRGRRRDRCSVWTSRDESKCIEMFINRI